MNLNEFHKQLADAPLSFRRKLRDYLRHPTERNACYITGYVAALEDARLFKTGDAASYWVTLIERTEGSGALGCDLIDEMDNPPNGGTHADKVVFIDGVGAGRRDIESCRDGVQWIIVGDRIYWPLSDADAQRLQSACCGNGSFDGPASSAGDCVPKTEREHAAAREIEALRAEVERLSRYYKNGIDCFANPCERHSGDRTPPFAEFFEKYGGQCLICVVDNNKALQAENERLTEALRELEEREQRDEALLRQALEALDSDHPDIQLRTAIVLRERLGVKT